MRSSRNPEQAYRSILAHGTAHSVGQLRTLDGRLLPVEFVARLVDDAIVAWYRPVALAR